MSKASERRKGLIEALASLSGCALVVVALYGINIIMAASTHDVLAMVAN